MTTDVSPALSIKRFIDKLGKAKDQRTTAAVIAQAFGVSEDSPDFQILIYSQIDNFCRLFAQLELADMSKEARGTYKKQLLSLMHVVRFDSIKNRYEATRSQYIDGNYVALTYLDDKLGMKAKIEEPTKIEIEKIAAQLEGALQEALSSNLSLRVKSLLQVQISRLIFLLKNFEIAGVDQAWEEACAAFATLHREAAPAAKGLDTNEKSVFTTLHLSLTAAVGLLAIVSTGADQLVSIGKHVKAGYDLIEQWKKPQSSVESSKELQAGEE